MKIHIFYLVLLCLFCSIGCSDTVTLSYDESTEGSILSTNVTLSPEENVKSYLSQVGGEFSKIKIYNESGNSCACTITGGNCTCKLPNAKGASGQCSDANSKCTRNKVIKIKVKESEKELFSAIGFK